MRRSPPEAVIAFAVSTQSLSELRKGLSGIVSRSDLESLRIELNGHVENKISYSPHFHRRPLTGRPRTASGKASQTQLFKNLVEALRDKPNLDCLILKIDPTLLSFSREQMQELGGVFQGKLLSHLVLDIHDETPSLEKVLEPLAETTRLQTLELRTKSRDIDVDSPEFLALSTLLANNRQLTSLVLRGMTFSEPALSLLLKSLSLGIQLKTLSLFSPEQYLSQTTIADLILCLQNNSIRSLDLSRIQFNSQGYSPLDPSTFLYLSQELPKTRINRLRLPGAILNHPQSLSALIRLLEHPGIKKLKLTVPEGLDRKEFSRFCNFIAGPSCQLQDLILSGLSKEQDEIFTRICQNNPELSVTDGFESSASLAGP